MKKIASFLLLFTYAYAVIRYHYGKNVPFHEWLYVLNKAFSWTGFTLIGLSILPKSWFDQCHLVRKEAGIIAYSFCILHLLINFSLMNSTRYPFLYLSTNEWSWQGIFTLILGSLSFCCFTIALIGSINIFGSNETKKRIKKV